MKGWSQLGLGTQLHSCGVDSQRRGIQTINSQTWRQTTEKQTDDRYTYNALLTNR